jgi:hypothetical protein
MNIGEVQYPQRVQLTDVACGKFRHVDVDCKCSNIPMKHDMMTIVTTLVPKAQWLAESCYRYISMFFLLPLIYLIMLDWDRYFDNPR